MTNILTTLERGKLIYIVDNNLTNKDIKIQKLEQLNIDRCGKEYGDGSSCAKQCNTTQYQQTAATSISDTVCMPYKTDADCPDGKIATDGTEFEDKVCTNPPEPESIYLESDRTIELTHIPDSNYKYSYISEGNQMFGTDAWDINNGNWVIVRVPWGEDNAHGKYEMRVNDKGILLGWPDGYSSDSGPHQVWNHPEVHGSFYPGGSSWPITPDYISDYNPWSGTWFQKSQTSYKEYSGGWPVMTPYYTPSSQYIYRFFNDGTAWFHFIDPARVDPQAWGGCCTSFKKASFTWKYI